MSGLKVKGENDVRTMYISQTLIKQPESISLMTLTHQHSIKAQ